VIVAAPGPDWASIMTAIGTVAVAIAAVGIALWTDWRSGVRIAAEQARHDKETADERALADKRLADQQAHSDKQLADEREAADARLQRQLEAAAAQAQTERDAGREREQLAEAYAVQVTPARMDPKTYNSQITTSDPEDPITCPCVFIANTGHYTITEIHAQFSPEGSSLVGYGDRVHLSSWAKLPPEIVHRIGLSAHERNVRNDTLTPADMGLLFVHDAMAESKIFGCYPVVRWRDQWRQRWEHKLGVVRKIAEGEQWKP
jgi:F0F1-type ATP synthase epsilon subunit